MEVGKPAAFYSTMFSWNLREGSDSLHFEDPVGHVIGHFMPDLPSAGDAGATSSLAVTAPCRVGIGELAPQNEDNDVLFRPSERRFECTDEGVVCLERTLRPPR